jgi:predicted RNA binding protein YcfA (HicA-like mRNA interferase family)
MQTTGSHAQVYHGTAKHTSGGLTKKDLVVNKHGRIVSRKKMMQGKKALKYLIRAGYKAKKGSFKLFHKTAKRGTRSRGKTAKKFF